MRFIDTQVVDAVIVVPDPFADARGTFARIFCAEEFAGRGLETAIAQANVATTRHAGTVRGLHYQLPPMAEAKLVRCIQGAVYDVIVDLRHESASFGSWFGAELTAETGSALYVPPGCAHGYQALTDHASVLYHVSAPYTADLERGVHPADPDLGIHWPLPARNLSDKDGRLPPLSGAELPALPVQGQLP